MFNEIINEFFNESNGLIRNNGFESESNKGKHVSVATEDLQQDHP